MSIKEKKPTPNERWGNLLNGRLTDKQIFDLFDEFGMAKRLQTKDDYEWVRHNLPNIPEELQKILKIEIDRENSKRKADADEEKEARKPVKEPSATGGSPDGQGGPAKTDFYKDAKGNYYTLAGQKITNPTELQGYAKAGGKEVAPPAAAVVPSVPADPAAAAPSTSWNTSADASLVKFTGDPNGADPGDASTIWWVDHKTNTFRPIMSGQALRDLYPDDAHYQAALNSVSIVPPTELQAGGKLANFIDLGVDYGIYEGKKTKKLEFNPNEIKNAYGQTRSQQGDTSGMQILNSFITFLNNPDSGIDSSFLNKIKNDLTTVAFYINAIAYGGYTPDDIYKDIKRKELVSKGDKSLENVRVISSNINRDNYVKTNPGRLAASLPSLTPPAQIGDVSREVWNSPASMLNDKYYELTDPSSYDPTSTGFKEQLDAIKQNFYDMVIKSLTAKTEAEKIVADQEWKDYKDQLEKNYNIKLDDNAMTAWNQLSKMEQTNAESGLTGSGIANEQQDKYLASIRLQNERIREEKANTDSSKEGSVARASYSPEQIKAMNDEDSAKGLPREEWRAYKYGLVPKTAVTSASFIADFRKAHPDLISATDAEIKEKYFDNIYDANGNYRSTLYQNYQDNVFKTKYGFNLNAIPEISEQQYKLNTLAKDKLDKEDAQQKDIRTAETGDLFSDVKGDVPGYGVETPKVPATSTSSDTSTWKSGTIIPTQREGLSNSSDTSTWKTAQAASAPKKMITGYDQSGKAVQVEQGAYNKGISLTPPTVKKATVWDPTKGSTSKKVVNVGDPFEKGYQPYTGK